jgi:hypothetical protein
MKRILAAIVALLLADAVARAYVVPAEVTPGAGVAGFIRDTLTTYPFAVNSLRGGGGTTLCGGDSAVSSAGRLTWRYSIAFGGPPVTDASGDSLDLGTYALTTACASVKGCQWDTSGTCMMGDQVIINSYQPTIIVSGASLTRHFVTVYTDPGPNGSQHVGCDSWVTFKIL